jgi:hypothetical protein
MKQTSEHGVERIIIAEAQQVCCAKIVDQNSVNHIV